MRGSKKRRKGWESHLVSGRGLVLRRADKALLLLLSAEKHHH
jgi:hypothetical protein